MLATRPRASALRRALLELGLLVVTPLLLQAIRYFKWGAGVYRLLGCVVLFAVVGLMTWRRGYLRSVFEGRWRWVLGAVAGALFALHVAAFTRDIVRGGECLTDMGRPSICASEWLREGKNPWAQCFSRKARAAAPKGSTLRYCLGVSRCIDFKGGGTYRHWTHHGPGFDFMDGYKYGPLLALSYAPLTHALRERGLFITNFVFWLAQGALTLWIARTVYPSLPVAGLRALVIWLLPLWVPTALLFPPSRVFAFGTWNHLVAPERRTFVLELTRRCANDVIPVAFMLGSVLLAACRRSIASGVLLGLSLGEKQLPGMLLALLLPRLRRVHARRFLIAAAATTTLVYLPAFSWAPREMIANLLLFGLVRPTNSSSVRAYLPPEFEVWIGLAQLALVAAIALGFGLSRRRDPPALMRAAALISIGFVALNKVVHGNYLLWLQPFVALALAGLPFRPPPSAPAATASAVKL